MTARRRLVFDTSRGGPYMRRLFGKFFRRYGNDLEDAIADGTKRGVEDVLDEWRRLATNLAPLDTGSLRRGIDTEIERDGKTWSGNITASAISVKGKRRFDYAEYIHDNYPLKYGDRFRNPTTGGTIPRFIAEPYEDNQSDWAQQIERELKAEIKRRGL